MKLSPEVEIGEGQGRLIFKMERWRPSFEIQRNAAYAIPIMNNGWNTASCFT